MPNPTREDLIAQISRDLPGFLPTDSQTPVLRSIDYRIMAKSHVIQAAALLHAPTAVEPLLEEIATFLAKCLATRRYKYELEEKAINFWLLQRRDKDLTAIRRRSLEAGEFSVPVAIAESELRAITAQEDLLASALSTARRALEIRRPEDSTARQRIDKSAEVTTYLAPVYSEAVRPIAERLEEIKLYYEMLTSTSSVTEVEMKQTQYGQQRTSIEQRLPFLRKRQVLENAKQQTEETYLDNREAAATARGSAINYGDRILEAQRLFDADFASALSRARALAKGLRLIYGITASLPELHDEGALTELLIWVRTQTDAVNLINDNSRSFTYSCVLNDLFTAAEWERGVLSGLLSFALVPPLDAALRFPRIRAIRLAADGTGTGLLGRARVMAPELFSGEGYEGRTGYVGDLSAGDPIARTGRLQGRTLFNRNPFGEWSIAIALRRDIQPEALLRMNVVFELSIEAIVEA